MTRRVALCRSVIVRITGCYWCLVVFAGCAGESGPKCYPVHGTVTVNNEPLVEGGMVVFHPLDAAGPAFPKPLGYTDNEGHFELTTTSPKDGAPPGKYAITVELRDLREDGDEIVRDGRNLLPDKYRRPKTSGFEFTVRAGDNEVPVLDMKQEVKPEE